MAKEEGGFDAIEDLKWLVLVMVVIWVVWFLTGGPARYEANHGIFLKPPSPLSTGETYGETPKVSIKIPDTLNISLYNNRALVGAKNNLGSSNSGQEYLEIVNQSDSPIDITGWRLLGDKDMGVPIPKGVRIPLNGKVNKEEDIYLSSGQRAIIVTGKSPLGISFRINSCSGYLSQFQDFTPKLNNVCPSPIDANTLASYPLDNACVDYLNKMPICITPTKALPGGLSSTCREFIFTHTTYNTCVADNKDNADFLGNEWRIYLGQTSELWNNHDTIKFYDRDGNFIGAYKY